MALTKEQRENLPQTDFAVPGKRALPIHDANHVRMAWNMVGDTKGLSDAERREARERILKRAHDFGIKTEEWRLSASFSFEAMSLAIPEQDHPNRLPFRGILTRLDSPSDNPVGGANGHRTLIPAAVGEAGIASLLGMAVDYKPGLDGHDSRAKIGLITEAYVEGDAIHIAGFFYAKDFPEEVARIQSEKDSLGFSYEADARIRNLEADPWVIDQITFTGAAVLYKDLAAYTTTSLAAQAEQDIAMTKEEMLAILTEANKPIAASIDALNKDVADLKASADKATLAASAAHDRVKPHVEALRSAAASMEAAGIGTHATQGHANVLRHMAASMEADAIKGNVPHVYTDHDYLNRRMEAGADTKSVEDAVTAAVAAAVKPLQDSLDAANTTVADLKASAFNGSKEPERKTLAPEVKALLEKHELTASADAGTLTAADVDRVLEAQGVRGRAAIETKLKLMNGGALKVK